MVVEQLSFLAPQKEPTVKSWGDLRWWKGEHQPMVWDEVTKRSGDNYCPTKVNVYRALDVTPLDKVRVVILGQDPYPNPTYAMGLAFSVPEGSSIPQSLVNIMMELNSDVGCGYAISGDLTAWARQGVLLLNTSLTTECWKTMAHADVGWQKLTDEVIETILIYRRNVVFILWGNHAWNTFNRVNLKHPGHLVKNEHAIIRGAHPSPRSAHRGFFGTKPFSRANAYLTKSGPPISWCLT